MLAARGESPTSPANADPWRATARDFYHGLLSTVERLILTLGICAVAVASLCGQSWPMFRGNPQQTGIYEGELPTRLEPLWTFRIEDGVESTAAVVAGSVYVGGLNGVFYAFDLDDGGVRWTFKATDEIRSSPLVQDGKVFFGDEMGSFFALRGSDGKQLWTFQAGAGITSPANFFGESVLFGSYDNFIYCLSRENGQLRWKQETGGYIHGSPVIVDDTVAVTGCDGFLRLIRISDGVEVERIELGAYIGSSPAYSQKRLYVGTFENQVLSFDLEEKEVEWVYEHTQRHFPFYSSPAVTKNLVVIGGRDKMVHGIDRSTGEVRWTFLTRSRVDSSPVVVGQTVLIADARGVLSRLALGNRQSLVAVRLGRWYSSVAGHLGRKAGDRHAGRRPVLSGRSRRAVRFFLFLLVLVYVPPTGLAQESREKKPGEPEEESEQRTIERPFVVTVEESLPPLASETTIATKMAVPIHEIPASVTVIPQSLFKSQDAVILSDALTNAAGVNIQTNFGVHDHFLIRGFDSLSSGLVLTDAASEPEATFYHLYNVDQIEVLRGPSTFLYGGSPLSGAVNLAPEAAAPRRTLFPGRRHLWIVWDPARAVRRQLGRYGLSGCFSTECDGPEGGRVPPQPGELSGRCQSCYPMEGRGAQHLHGQFRIRQQRVHARCGYSSGGWLHSAGFPTHILCFSLRRFGSGTSSAFASTGSRI